jgi:enoyl-CoA hydratase
VRLSRQIPYTLAAEYLLTGRHIPAAEAREVGLIGHVVPDGTALDRAVEIAQQIAANAPLSVQAVLRSLRETRELTEADGLAHELEIGFPIIGTDDAKEGARAFKEKRSPVWQGR